MRRIQVLAVATALGAAAAGMAAPASASTPVVGLISGFHFISNTPVSSNLLLGNDGCGNVGAGHLLAGPQPADTATFQVGLTQGIQFVNTDPVNEYQLEFCTPTVFDAPLMQVIQPSKRPIPADPSGASMTFQPYAWGAQPGGTYFFHDTIHAIYGVIDVGLS